MSAADDLLEAERRLQAAMLASDVDALDDLLHPDLRAVGPGGEMFGKDDDRDLHRQGAIRLESLEEDSLELRVAGDTGVTFVVLRMKGSIAGQELPPLVRYTRTWTREGGRWRVLAAVIAAAGG